MSLLDEVESPTALRALDAARLPELCRALREEIVQVCERVGGHLGASLGVVELTVALHRVFKSPVDRLVFDTGHQGYAHKLLTGRRARMGTLRQAGGVAPFIDPQESPHDAFGVGHASTAVSAALGILEGKAQQAQPGQVVAIVGDGALTGGLTFEGLNNAGFGQRPLKVVLNHNGMSISPNVGAVAPMLDRDPRAFFEALGFVYLGPVDGHDLDALLPALTRLRDTGLPAVLHVRTHKGHGFAPAEGDERTRGHAMGPFEWRGGKLVRSRQGKATFSDAFSRVLEARMARDARVVAVTPGMIEGSALQHLAERFPARVFDVGIAEAHAVTFAAGMARAGLEPVVCIYSTFLQRAVDQVVHDVALQRLNVVFAVDRAGLVGADGATHQGLLDLAHLRAIPGVCVLAPVWGADLEAQLDYALSLDGPAAIRFPRGVLPEEEGHAAPGDAAPAGAGMRAPGATARLGGPSLRARWLKRPPSPALTFVTCGPLALAALDAASSHADWAVLDAQSIAPLDEAAVLEAARAPLITVEEATTRGGLGSAVLECLARAGVSQRVRVLGLPADAFVPHGEARAQRAELGLDAAGLERAAQELLRP